ncbi:MAG: hypothetical protein K0R67_3083 [Paenibacillus sp.]|nr:hypothetical protein [Paenibacillus sp.]
MLNWDKVRTVLISACRDTWRFTRDYLYPFIITMIKYVMIIIQFICKEFWQLSKTHLSPALRELYARTPRKGIIGLGLLLVVGLGVIISVSLPGSQPSVDVFTQSAEEHQGHKTVKKLIDGTWEEQKLVVKQMLENTGMSVIEGDTLPSSESLFIIPPELTKLTYDANRKATSGHLTLEQLAILLEEAGFPFIEGKDPAMLLKQGIQLWVQAAIKDPGQEGADAPLFMHALAQEQIPAIDLASDEWLPHEYRLTNLELQVFLGTFYQAFPVEKQTSSLTNWFRQFSNVASAAVPLPGACSYAKDWFVNAGKQSGQGTIATIGVGLVNILAQELTGMGISKLGNALSKVVTALSASLKVVKLAALYWSVEITVEATPETVHKPNSKEADKEIVYTATAGVNEVKYQEYLTEWNSNQVVRDIKDCLSFAGIPMPTDTGDIAADVDKWSVEWDLVQGGGHATFGLDKNKFDQVGQLQMMLKRTSAIKGEAKLVVDLEREDTKDHKGTERTVPVTVKAVLETSAPPDFLSSSFGAGKQGFEASSSGALDLLGLSDVLMDVLAGWVQEMAEPVSYGSVNVTYHEPKNPVYSYDGWLRAEKVVNKSVITEKLIERENLSYQGKWQITSDYLRGESYSELVGVGTSQGVYDYFKLQDLSSASCHKVTVKVEEAGQTVSDHEFAGNIIRKGNDKDGYVYHLTYFYEKSFKINGIQKFYHDHRTWTGCGQSQSDSNTEDTEREVFLELGEVFTITKQAYPTVLKGRKRLVNPVGEVTIWTWDLYRNEHEPGPGQYQREPFR